MFFLHMNESTAWVKEWESLIGSVIGVLGALIVAEVVAARALWRDFRVAFGLVSVELQRYKASVDSMLREVVVSADIDSKEFRDSVEIVRLRPRLAGTFEQSLAKIQGVDQTLTTQVGAAMMLIDAAEREFGHIEELYGRYRHKEDLGYTPNELADKLASALCNAGDAMHYIELASPRLKTLGRVRAGGLRLQWYRLRRLLGREAVPKSAELPPVRLNALIDGERTQQECTRD